ncbi:MAG: hypothetical protein FRX49_12544 [Trebouxia sp. A1-2]|nr:MAG: hypothetical protein FRX49_12544 [Trebouxia sp. A1-2]
MAAMRMWQIAQCTVAVPAMFLDLAPTTPSLKSSIPTTHLPHHLGTLTVICFFFFFSLGAAAVCCSTASQLTPPAAVGDGGALLVLDLFQGALLMADGKEDLHVTGANADMGQDIRGVGGSVAWKPDSIADQLDHNTEGLATTNTLPVTLTGLISCQAPSSAAALKPGSMALRMRLTAKAGPPLTTSSAKRSTAQSSTLKALPKALEMGCRRAFTLSLVSEMALRMRSITAVACIMIDANLQSALHGATIAVLFSGLPSLQAVGQLLIVPSTQHQVLQQGSHEGSSPGIEVVHNMDLQTALSGDAIVGEVAPVGTIVPIALQEGYEGLADDNASSLPAASTRGARARGCLLLLASDSRGASFLIRSRGLRADMPMESPTCTPCFAGSALASGCIARKTPAALIVGSAFHTPMQQKLARMISLHHHVLTTTVILIDQNLQAGTQH